MPPADTESERTASLTLLNGGRTAECRNVFDTTALALTDMEQPNIAYGRRYVRLEVDADAYLPEVLESPPHAAPSSPRPGGGLSGRGLAALPLSREFVSRDRTSGSDVRFLIREDDGGGDGGGGGGTPPSDPPDGDDEGRPGWPVVRPTSFGMRDIVGWQPPASDDGEGVPEPPPTVPPGLYLVERYRLVTFARGFGLGDHLYSFTLFPEEEVEIEIKTWKRREQVDKTGSSIFDSHSDTAETEFAKAVEQENSRKSSREREKEAHIEASAEAGWGFGSASVKTGASRRSKDSVEDFARNVSNATQKLANKATRERRVEITQSSEMKLEEGEETRTTRKIRNLNKCHTLNYNYFQLIRKYETQLLLYDVRLRFSNGTPFWNDVEGVWSYEAEEVPLAEAAELLGRTINPEAVDEVLAALLAMLGAGTTDDPGLDVLTDEASAERLRLDTVPLEAQLAWEDAARAAAAADEAPPPRPLARVPKVLSREQRVIATNAVYVEAMLGKCSACEDFIKDSRILDVELRQLENRQLALELERSKLEQEKFREDPVPRRVIALEGLPASAQVHLYVDRATDRRSTIAIEGDES